MTPTITSQDHENIEIDDVHVSGTKKSNMDIDDDSVFAMEEYEKVLPPVLQEDKGSVTIKRGTVVVVNELDRKVERKKNGVIDAGA